MGAQVGSREGAHSPTDSNNLAEALVGVRGDAIVGEIRAFRASRDRRASAPKATSARESGAGTIAFVAKDSSVPALVTTPVGRLRTRAWRQRCRRPRCSCVRTLGYRIIAGRCAASSFSSDGVSSASTEPAAIRG
jgi:hypothetical protein